MNSIGMAHDEKSSPAQGRCGRQPASTAIRERSNAIAQVALVAGVTMHWANNVALQTIPGIPVAKPGDNVAELIVDALKKAHLTLEDHDVLAVASKIFSRAEGRFVNLKTVKPTDQAIMLAERVNKEPALVQLILDESSDISRDAPGVLIVRHKLGHISANAAIDRSNAAPPNVSDDDGQWVLLLPEDPDHSARKLRDALEQKLAVTLGVIITDSFGRPFRVGTVGTAIGVAGVPAVWDMRGAIDLDGRPLEHTSTALADQIAAAADMLAGQAGEGRPATIVRGLKWNPQRETSAQQLLRDKEKDLYA